MSVQDQRAVITKDTDFYYSHLLLQRPHKLLLIRTAAGTLQRRAGAFMALADRRQGQLSTFDPIASFRRQTAMAKAAGLTVQPLRQLA